MSEQAKIFTIKMIIQSSEQICYNKREKISDDKFSASQLESYAMNQIVLHVHQNLKTFIDAAELEKKY